MAHPIDHTTATTFLAFSTFAWLSLLFYSRLFAFIRAKGVWTNCPSVIPAKMSRLNSITNPTADGFKWIKGTKTFTKTVWSMFNIPTKTFVK